MAVNNGHIGEIRLVDRGGRGMGRGGRISRSGGGW